MLCLRCRALPALQTPVSTMRTPMTRPITPSTLLAYRPFSTTLLSTPTRLQQTQPQTLSLQTPSTSASLAPSISSLLPPQTRSFSATASLGVKRNTFRPSRRVQKRRSGFLARNTDRKGRLTIIRRRVKGRKAMSW
ncbi:uncharacterized protein N7458_009762 [Penicillium daleae]|uniref:Ribosomal protein L34 n=1 Tax=Penicillium daleae TaxID=63821 RepID=A0AAD6FZ86_9EURO|nr:uncharacterized protein N7458_009762 [Penicillium daleae]KAJ5438764.1 hypothetical protein N7458_009762 [Penicillium daleae]